MSGNTQNPLHEKHEPEYPTRWDLFQRRKRKVIHRDLFKFVQVNKPPPIKKCIEGDKTMPATLANDNKSVFLEENVYGRTLLSAELQFGGMDSTKDSLRKPTFAREHFYEKLF